jgi:hypothetical protein
MSFDQDVKNVEWVCWKLDIDRGYFGPCSTIAIKDVAVAVYSSFNGVNCEVTIASESAQWLKKKYLSILMAYPFKQLGCERITVLVKVNNSRTIKTAIKVGFTMEGVLRKFMESGEDVVILGYLKEEYEMSKYNEPF